MPYVVVVSPLPTILLLTALHRAHLAEPEASGVA